MEDTEEEGEGGRERTGSRRTWRGRNGGTWEEWRNGHGGMEDVEGHGEWMEGTWSGGQWTGVKRSDGQEGWRMDRRNGGGGGGGEGVEVDGRNRKRREEWRNGGGHGGGMEGSNGQSG
ncbi:glycine-rich RNA-binding protein 8-like [Haliotis rubra]|uniref:glycine-rich RNA-binding protein 8-like n=1 Tax=Haliotis rubra TaxID=36100 RepID=UPI001EE5B999|nr:glycine-rich RNA-binding protein 8-like [Haliotis rubra]